MVCCSWINQLKLNARWSPDWVSVTPPTPQPLTWLRLPLVRVKLFLCTHSQLTRTVLRKWRTTVVVHWPSFTHYMQYMHSPTDVLGRGIEVLEVLCWPCWSMFYERVIFWEKCRWTSGASGKYVDKSCKTSKIATGITGSPLRSVYD